MRVEPRSERVRASLVAERVLAVLSAGLAASAVILVCAAVFGVLSHLVVRRTHEIGIRLALGASRGAVIRPVVSHAIGVAVAGVIAGLVGARTSTGVLRGLVYGVDPAAPSTYAMAAGIMLAAAALTSVVPARRAATVDPVVALRVE